MTAAGGEDAEPDEVAAAEVGPAVQDAAPGGRDGRGAPARAEQGAGDGGDGVGVAAAADGGFEGEAEVVGGELVPAVSSGTGVRVIADQAPCRASTTQPLCANDDGGRCSASSSRAAHTSRRSSGSAVERPARRPSNVPWSTAWRMARHHSAHASPASGSAWVSALRACAASTSASGSSR